MAELGLNTSFRIFITNLQKPHTVGDLLLNNSYIDYFYFIEDIESMYIIGRLQILDKTGIFETLNFTGKEKFHVFIIQEIDDKTYTKQIVFDVYDTIIEDNKFQKVKYVFELVEEGALDFFGANFSKGYNNKRVSEIVTDVMKTQLNLLPTDYNVEQTFDTLPNFVIPFWKPALTIKNLRRKARRMKSPHEGGFVFYSSTGDGLEKTRKERNGMPTKNFVSVASLTEAKQNYNRDEIDQNYVFKKFDINELYINNIRECRNVTSGKRNLLKDGIGGKKYFGVDYNTDKNIIEYKQTYSEYIKKSSLVGDIAHFDKTIDGVNDDVDYIGGQDYIIQAVQDNSFRMLLESYDVKELIVSGALFRYCGQIINITQMADTENDLINNHDTGFWLIKGITHHWEEGIYSNKLVIVKDALNRTNITSSDLIKK